jgi:F0F1-type ATP synthase assembly protein I
MLTTPKSGGPDLGRIIIALMAGVSCAAVGVLLGALLGVLLSFGSEQVFGHSEPWYVFLFGQLGLVAGLFAGFVLGFRIIAG